MEAIQQDGTDYFTARGIRLTTPEQLNTALRLVLDVCSDVCEIAMAKLSRGVTMKFGFEDY